MMRVLKPCGLFLVGFWILAVAASVAAWGAASRALAEEPLAYQMPPKVIADIIDAPPTPAVSIGPRGEWMLLIERPGLPSIEEVAQPELRLAGLRINPRTNGPSRQWTYHRLTFRRISDGRELEVTGLPPEPKITNVEWSPDGRRIAFTVTRERRMELWSAALDDERAQRVIDAALNGAYADPYEWLPDASGWVVLTVPEDRGDPPPEPLVPVGPIVQENLGRKTPARTLQDLLENAHDEALFEYYTTARIERVSLKGKRKAVGEPAVYRGASPSPDGNYLLVQSVHRPFSYTLQEDAFPRRIEVWDRDGRLVHLVADLPLQDQVPITFGSVPTGPRSVGWRDDADAELVWVEALDGGDAGLETEERDRVLALAAPFDAAPTGLITLGQRYGGASWGSDELAIVTEWWWQTRNVKAWRIRPGDPSAPAQLLHDRSWEDRYNDPGRPLTRPTERGQRVLITSDDGNTIYLSGDGASPEGDRPFLDAFDLTTLETERLFRSEAPYYERPVRLLDAERGHLLTRREAQDEPPNFFLRDLRAGEFVQKTFFPDPTPQLVGIQKELIRYERADGLPLTATLYLPADYDPQRDGPLPMLMWAYPEEYKSSDAAGQVDDSPYRFRRVGWWSALLWLVRGYAVLDDPSMAVVGEGDEEPNDTYVEQLVASARAAVDEVVRRGVADRDRIAIGGHSYGAFMAANLLAHSDLFRLGVARSGAYNRTLTPFGFQSEERTLWEAPQIYFEMSPFMHADAIDEPLLMIHGQADSNSGTYPMQSERLYGALKGLGATVRLVMLPHESHGYRARESVMHVLWETSTWLDRYVKSAPPRGTEGS